MATIIKKRFFCFLFFALAAATDGFAQITIGKPTLSFTQICADADYNTQVPILSKVTFTFSPQSALSSTNQFIVELSDATGSFSNPIILVSSDVGAVSGSPATLGFRIPTNIAGEAYKIRIRSTTPASTSPDSNTFSAYYQIQNAPFSINNFVETATYCAGGSYVLRIDNPGTGTNDSPLKYPSLTYNWFRDNGNSVAPTLLVSASTGSYTVTQAGKYYVETNYGSCTSNSYSNRVTVSESAAQVSSITSNKGNPFCASEGTTTLSTQAANSYQWFLDDLKIEGATANTYEASKAGLYVVKVDFGGCITNASINLQKIQFLSAINLSGTNTIKEGETKTVITTTTAENPAYQWFLNDVLIDGANGATFDATTAGDYKVVITQTSSCRASNEFLFTIEYPIIDRDVVLIPNFISPNGDGINDTWVIPQEYLSGTNTEVLLMSSTGEQILKTNNYQNNWPENMMDFKNVNPVYYYIISTQGKKVKKGSITVIK
ncbi:gliding motility-associated C-terminal domain-containing protein [uncultured Flavobacterium sp.]|uniref:T9SS type B sorting domain-containing protein n=1 Tax=uncultured Flavobacterium sp. TaxID=165435 RepID=UPI0030EEFF5E|tara:strand:+ start:1916 stop:3388 length:1473 start_codon:yes stop_codon:yes gene_type:complete